MQHSLVILIRTLQRIISAILKIPTGCWSQSSKSLLITRSFYLQQSDKRLVMSELNRPVKRRLEGTVHFGNLSSELKKKLDRFRLTFPTCVMQRWHTLLVFRVEVATLKDTTSTQTITYKRIIYTVYTKYLCNLVHQQLEHLYFVVKCRSVKRKKIRKFSITRAV